MKPRVLVLSFSNLDDKIASGGMVRLARIFGRLTNKIELILGCTDLGKRAYERELKASYWLLKGNVQNNITSMFRVVSLYSELTARACLANIAKNKTLDVVYAASTYLPDVITAARIKKANPSCGYVQVVHHLVAAPGERKGNPLSNLLAFLDQRISLKLAKKYADKIIVLNSDVKNFLLQHGFDERRVELNYNGVDLKSVKDFGDIENIYDCAFVGRIDPNKGLMDLTKIMRFVSTKRPSTRFVVVGSGLAKYVKWLEDEINDSGLRGKVVTTGGLENYRDVLRTLKGSKVMVFPSREEGFGIVIVEALACRCLPVVWNTSLFAELFPHGIKRIVTFDHEKFADEVVKLCDDEQYRSSSIEDGQSLLATYNWDGISEKEYQIMMSCANFSINNRQSTVPERVGLA